MNALSSPSADPVFEALGMCGQTGFEHPPTEQMVNWQMQQMQFQQQMQHQQQFQQQLVHQQLQQHLKDMALQDSELTAAATAAAFLAGAAAFQRQHQQNMYSVVSFGVSDPSLHSASRPLHLPDVLPAFTTDCQQQPTSLIPFPCCVPAPPVGFPNQTTPSNLLSAAPCTGTVPDLPSTPPPRKVGSGDLNDLVTPHKTCEAVCPPLVLKLSDMVSPLSGTSETATPTLATAINVNSADKTSDPSKVKDGAGAMLLQLLKGDGRPFDRRRRRGGRGRGNRSGNSYTEGDEEDSDHTPSTVASDDDHWAGQDAGKELLRQLKSGTFASSCSFTPTWQSNIQHTYDKTSSDFDARATCTVRRAKNGEPRAPWRA